MRKMTTRDAAIPTPIASRVPNPELVEEVGDKSPSNPEIQQYIHRKYHDKNTRRYASLHIIKLMCQKGIFSYGRLKSEGIV